jgi:hypothetical protein
MGEWLKPPLLKSDYSGPEKRGMARSLETAIRHRRQPCHPVPPVATETVTDGAPYGAPTAAQDALGEAGIPDVPTYGLGPDRPTRSIPRGRFRVFEAPAAKTPTPRIAPRRVVVGIPGRASSASLGPCVHRLDCTPSGHPTPRPRPPGGCTVAVEPGRGAVPAGPD